MSDDGWSVLFHEITAEFTPGVPIREKDLLSGRLSQIELLQDVVEQPGKHAVIFGEAGVGKTSLASTFALGTGALTRQIYLIRVNAEPDDTFSSLWRRVFKKFNVTFRSEGIVYTGTLSDEYERNIGPDDVLFELEGISANVSPVIIIDEFNSIEEKSVTSDVSRVIKNVSDYGLNCTIIIVGISKDVTALIQGHTSINRQLVQVNMPRMSMKELSDLISRRLQRLEMSIDPDLLWKVCFVSRGMPFFAHLLGFHSARAAVLDLSRRIVDEHFEVGIGSALAEVEQILLDTYVNGTMSKKGDTLFKPVLLACALAESDELGRFQQKAVQLPLSRISPKEYRATTYAFHVNEFCQEKRLKILEDVGMAEGQNPRYRFQDPLMQPYVILRGIKDGTLSKTVADSFIPERQPSFPI